MTEGKRRRGRKRCASRPVAEDRQRSSERGESRKTGTSFAETQREKGGGRISENHLNPPPIKHRKGGLVWKESVTLPEFLISIGRKKAAVEAKGEETSQ